MTGIFYVLLRYHGGWNGYRNKSQHRKSTLEKKILPPFQQGFEPATFQSRVRCSNHWAIPAPLSSVVECWRLYVHRNRRRLIMDGNPGQPPRLSHSSCALTEWLDSPATHLWPSGDTPTGACPPVSPWSRRPCHCPRVKHLSLQTLGHVLWEFGRSCVKTAACHVSNKLIVSG